MSSDLAAAIALDGLCLALHLTFLCTLMWMLRLKLCRKYLWHWRQEKFLGRWCAFGGFLHATGALGQ